MLTHKHTEESKQKMRLKSLGRKLSLETREKMRKAKLGKKHTPEHNLSISRGCLGLTLSIEQKKNLSISKSGEKNPMWKGGVSHYRCVHGSLAKWHGKATKCENKENNLFDFKCTGESEFYDWAKKMNSKYTSDINDYYQLCRLCHHKYDKNAPKS